MNDDVGVTADRRREVSVEAESESVVEELIARDASRGEVRSDGHGVSGQVAQDLVDVRIGVVGSGVETRRQSLG